MVELPINIANSLDRLLERYESKEKIIQLHAMKKYYGTDWMIVSDYADNNYEDFIKCLANGYTVKMTTLDHLKERYLMYKEKSNEYYHRREFSQQEYFTGKADAMKEIAMIMGVDLDDTEG